MASPISTVRIPWSRPVIWGNEAKYASEAISARDWSIGNYLRRFEEEFGQIHALEGRCISVNNGTSSLHLAFLALGIGPGDEVIVPGFAFLAAANMALMVGATPVFVDVDSDTWLTTPASILAAVTARTRAIVLVHTYGPVCDVEEVMRSLAGSGIWVIEDCAESPFSKIDGKICGSLGHIASWSLQATKTISCGEGGVVASVNEDIVQRMKLYRSHGMTAERKYYHEVIGHNFRLTNFQAAIAFAQLEHKDEIIASRRRIYNSYRDKLLGLPYRMQVIPNSNDPLMWAIGLIADDLRLIGRRDEIVRGLAENGVEVRPGFVSATMQPNFKASNLPVSDYLGRELFSLPFPSDLSEDEIYYVISSLERVTDCLR